MKVAAAKKREPVVKRALPVSAADVHLDRVHDDDDESGGNTFLYDMLKRAGISGKQFAYRMRISRTTKQKWFRGELDDPIERCKILCDLLKKSAPHLISVVLLEIAGDGYDGLILDPVKRASLEELAKAVKE